MTKVQTAGTAGVRRIVRAVLAVLVLAGLPLLGGNPAQAQTTAQGSWELTGSLSAPRFDHSLTLLANGKVLAAGGRTQNVTPVSHFNTAEVYDPITETWTPTGPKIGRAHV